MPNRILKESLCSSDTVDLLSAEEERLFTRLITKCDDFGCFDARPAILRAECFPLKVDRISLEQMAIWTMRLASVGLIRLYAVNGRSYLQMVTWGKHQQQRATKPKYPLPDATNNEECTQLLATDSNGNQIPSYSYSYPVSGNVLENEPERAKADKAAVETTGDGSDAPAGAPPDGGHSLIDLLKHVEEQLAEPKAQPAKIAGQAFAAVFGVKVNYGLIAGLLRDYDAPFEIVRLMVQIAPRWNRRDDPHRYLAAALRDKRQHNGRSEPQYLDDAAAEERRARNATWERDYGVAR